ncbi:phosphoribosylanthranilate isomerase [Oleiagrimonas citrea]|uniref:N-(5'-phosphoribosyl)anthranilate isomerase n=1 Tax=Oleiagrimonas citrea TaxID=1665687 RepID=A0A846ZN19_9GAMM|nr:phosphoribosylanthranilate isomerase [Oleiagrimonas citrea]
MTRTRVKFCGMTRVADAVAAAELGVDAIGMVFTPRSRRCVAIAQAKVMREAVPPFVDVVALFMDDDPVYVQSVIEAVRPDLLQFHGSETVADCTRYGRRYLKAVAMGEGADAASALSAHPRASGLLLDGHAPGAVGGSGQRFDWSRMPRRHAQPLILAGGLSSENVGDAIAAARPWGVDVASGIESSPGVKDAAKMHAFMQAVRTADRKRDEA